MKKTCLTLLAATALPAFAALDIASVDIEGITLGMNEKESAAIVKAYCEKEKDGKYEELPMPINEINFNASICSLNDFAAFSLDSNTVLVGIEQKINLDNINDKDFITKYFKTNCKVPSESSLSFVKDYNKDPKALREFLKNPVIK